MSRWGRRGVAAPVVVALLGCAVFGQARAVAGPVATLTAVGNGSEGLGPVTVAGDVAVSEASGVLPGVGGTSGPPVGYVFVERPGGWASGSQSATLVDGEGAAVIPTHPATTGAVVVLNAHAQSVSGGGPAFEDVFVVPSGGWSGTVRDSARLVASDGASLGAPAMSGSTVVATGVDQRTGASGVYVFVAPAQGWHGTITESARLTDPHAQQWQDVAIQGSTVVASGSTATDLFSEPPGGWSGTVTPDGALRDLFYELYGVTGGLPVSIQGGSILLGPELFTRPMRGWSGVLSPSGELSPLGDGQVTLGCCQALAGATSAFSYTELGADHECPCFGTVWLFTAPRSAWRGPIQARPAFSVTTTGGEAWLALAPGDVFVSGGTALQVYATPRKAGQRPRVAIDQARLTGLPTGHMRIQFRVGARPAPTPITSLSITPPKEIRFNPSAAALRAAVRVLGAQVRRVALAHSTLLMTLQAPARQVTVMIGPRALKETSALRRRALAAHRRPRVRFTIEASGLWRWNSRASITLA